MPNVSDAIQLRLSTSTDLAAIVEDRVYPVSPTTDTQVPFVVHSVSGSVDQTTNDGLITLAKYTVVVECWAINYQQVQDIQAIVKNLMVSFRGGIVDGITTLNATSDPVETGYHGMQSFTVWADEGSTPGTASIAVGTDSVVLTACDHTLTVGCSGLLIDGGPLGPDLTPYARKDQANTFTQPQVINGSTPVAVNALKVYDQEATFVNLILGRDDNYSSVLQYYTGDHSLNIYSGSPGLSGPIGFRSDGLRFQNPFADQYAVATGAGAWTFQPLNSSTTPLTVKGTSGQSAPIQCWSDSTGTSRTSIAANGDPVLTSPNGTRYRLLVANDGTLSTSPA